MYESRSESSGRTGLGKGGRGEGFFDDGCDGRRDESPKDSSDACCQVRRASETTPEFQDTLRFRYRNSKRAPVFIRARPRWRLTEHHSQQLTSRRFALFRAAFALRLSAVSGRAPSPRFSLQGGEKDAVER